MNSLFVTELRYWSIIGGCHAFLSALWNYFFSFTFFKLIACLILLVLTIMHKDILSHFLVVMIMIAFYYDQPSDSIIKVLELNKSVKLMKT